MNLPKRIAWVALMAAIAGGLYAIRQHSQLVQLEQDLAGRLIVRVPDASPAPAPAATNSLTSAEQVELLRLRADVTRLRQRERELSGAKADNQSLKAQAAAGTNGAGGSIVFPPGWVRRRDAQFVGTTSPEATLQSFLWALEHRDTNVLFQVVTGDGASELRRAMEHDPSPSFWDEAGKIPGFRLLGRREDLSTESEVTYTVEFMPENGATEIKFSRMDGQWLMRP